MQNSVFSGLYLELQRAMPNRWLGVVVAALMVATIATVVMAMPDQYESRSRMYINSEVVLRPLLRGIASEEDAESREDLLKVLQTTVLNTNNIDRLLEIPDLGFDLSTEDRRNKARGLIRNGVTIAEQEDTKNLFDLAYTDTDPTRARNVLQGLLAVMIESKMGLAQKGYDDARKFLDAQIEAYEQQLRELEAKITAHRMENAMVLGTTTHQQRRDAALAVLRDAQISRQVAASNRDRLKTQIEAAKKPGADATAALYATDQTFPAAIDRLTALQAQLSQLLLVFTDQHPDVIATKREIRLLTQQYGLGEDMGAAVAQPFTALPGQVPPSSAVNAAAGAPTQTTPAAVGPAATPVAAPARDPGGVQMQLIRANFAVMDAERRVRDAMAAVQAIEAEATLAPVAEQTLESMNREYAIVKENYEQLIRRRESAKITAAADISSGVEQFRVIEAATLPTAPASPDRPTFLILGALLAVVTGGALAYGLGLMRGAFVSAAEAEQTLGLPVIATLADQRGIVSRVSGAVDTMMLAGSIVGIFFAAYVISATAGWFAPLRDEIYRLFGVDLGQLGGLLQ
jgi:uncharacterized protein involved in exopolysaccharide biosynthesis